MMNNRITLRRAWVSARALISMVRLALLAKVSPSRLKQGSLLLAVLLILLVLPAPSIPTVRATTTVCPPSISFGETIQCSIVSVGEMDTYTFAANAGDKVLVRMSALSGSLDPVIRVYGPDGTKLCDAYGFSSTTEIASCALPSAGTYSILAFDYYGTQTGDYYLYLQRLNHPGNPVSIAFGQVFSGSISIPAEMDTYTFAANAGDKVLVGMSASSGSLDPVIRVYSPAGTKLCDAYVSTAEIASCVLTSTGTYSILAFDYYGTQTGDYYLYLQRLNNPGSTVSIIFGQILSGSISIPAEMDTYTFAASAGDKVLVRMTRSLGGFYPVIRVYGTDGTKLCDAYSFSSTAEIASCTLTNPGTYSILAFDYYRTQTGNYYLYLQRLNNPGSTPTGTSTPTATSTTTATATVIATNTPTNTPTATRTPTPTLTNTTPQTATRTPTKTRTPTATTVRTPTNTPPPQHRYLPAVIWQLPPTPTPTATLLPHPAVPILNSIIPPESAPSYTVRWSAANGATSYVLERAISAGFANAVEVYAGLATERVVASEGIMFYYYRVKTRNAWGESGWSNPQTVDVRWEREPNGEAVDATGPMQPGLRHYGVLANATDVNDYYYFELTATRTVELWLTNMATGQDFNLVLRDASLKLINYSGNLGNADEHILADSLPAGRYYVQVNNFSGPGSAQPYFLRVLFSQ